MSQGCPTNSKDIYTTMQQCFHPSAKHLFYR